MRYQQTRRTPTAQTRRRLAVLALTAMVTVPCGVASGRTGDLDPGFGDVGRVVPGLPGPAWSIELDGELGWGLFGGQSRFVRTWETARPYSVTSGFVARLQTDGAIDSARTNVTSHAVYASKRQLDGKIVTVGGRSSQLTRSSALVIDRVNQDGSADLEFGVAGRVAIETSVFLQTTAATSVALDPDGRIVVAGFRGGDLIVLRLLPNGAFDHSFAIAGIYTGTGVGEFRTAITRTNDGGYRVLTRDPEDTVRRCRVLGLTSAGLVDDGFGEMGYASPQPASSPVACNSLVAATQDRLLVAGLAGDRAFAVRLFSSGSVDPEFDAGGISNMSSIDALVTTGSGDRIVLAGRAPDEVTGAMIVRLRADGAPDLQFGDGGTAWFDLPNDGNGTAIQVNNLATLSDGGIVATGSSSGRPFVARLVGEGSDVNGPGVIAIKHAHIEVIEETSAVVTVRRIGGKSGPVNVSYRTPFDPESGEYTANPGEDFTAVEGFLHWGDGDASDREISIPVVADGGPAEEETEQFRLELYDVTDGGLGTSAATVLIGPDGSPAGLVSIGPESEAIVESARFAQVFVQRNYYSTGKVSVTVTPKSGTAQAGQDFSAGPITLTWADGETGGKYANIPITDDQIVESVETFTVEISGVTGGALVGQHAVATFNLNSDDPVADPPNDHPGQSAGGGGQIGWAILWMLSISSIGLQPKIRLRGPRSS